MASGSQNMTTYNARTVTGSNSAASPAGALLLSGEGRANDATGDTWLFLDSAGGTDTPWGIKHDQANNRIQIFGAGKNSVWTEMNTGNTYIGGSLNTGSILTVRAQNDAHEGGEIILSPATDSFSTAHIDAYDSLFRLHDGTNERFKVNISSGDTTINGNLGIGTDYAVSGGSYKLYVNGSAYFNGNTTHNGIDYFANGTTYYINNSGDSRLRYEYANTYTGYDSAGFVSSIAGSPWPYIRFDTRAGGSTYVTTDQTNWCQLYAQVPAKRDSTYYKTRFFFRQYSKTANTTTRLGYYEDYYLPETNDGRTDNAGYNILTTKDMSFSITGSAGSVAWSNVSSKPATATRWPAWNEISQSGADTLAEGGSNWTDNTEILTSYASNNGFADTNAKGVVYRRDAVCAYNYIKGKASGTWGISITGNAATATKATQDGSGNTITSKYVTLDTDQTITGTKTFQKRIIAHGYKQATNLPFMTFDKPGSYATGMGPDGTSNRIKFGPCDLAGTAWTAQSSFNSNQWFFQGSIYGTSTLTIESSATISGGIISNHGHNLMVGGNEFNCIPDGYNSTMWFNYESFGRTNNSTVSEYICGNGKHGHANLRAAKVYNAVWNDFAEYREGTTTEAGRVVAATADSNKVSLTYERLQPCAHVISDTFGCSVGQSDTAQTPIGVGGRVLVYPYQPVENYHVGDCLCAAPNGTADIMTREEIIQYPDRIIGIVDEIPDYLVWKQILTTDKEKHGSGKVETDIQVNGRIWIYVR